MKKYVNINCICGNKSTYITKERITSTLIRRRGDTFCDNCLNKLIRANVTNINEWSRFE